jgi:tetratricopeptide (TPR) repeat protein
MSLGDDRLSPPEHQIAEGFAGGEAYMLLSLINHHIAILSVASDPMPAMEAAYELGRRATQLDGRNEYAHWALGITCWGLHRLDEGIAALERAVDLNPNCSLAYGSLGTSLAIAGRTEEAIANQEIAIRISPGPERLLSLLGSRARALHGE